LNLRATGLNSHATGFTFTFTVAQALAVEFTRHWVEFTGAVRAAERRRRHFSAGVGG
jgi:hypothetical protein